MPWCSWKGIVVAVVLDGKGSSSIMSSTEERISQIPCRSISSDGEECSSPLSLYENNDGSVLGDAAAAAAAEDSSYPLDSKDRSDGVVAGEGGRIDDLSSAVQRSVGEVVNVMQLLLLLLLLLR